MASVRTLLKAALFPDYVAIDGKNRVIKERKTIVIVSTVDAAQVTHEIGFIQMSKGEKEEEVLRGLLILRRAIQVAHQATLDLPPDVRSAYNIPNCTEGFTPPPRDWVWDPRNTNNDGAKSFFNSWDKFHLASTHDTTEFVAGL